MRKAEKQLIKGNGRTYTNRKKARRQRWQRNMRNRTRDKTVSKARRENRTTYDLCYNLIVEAAKTGCNPIFVSEIEELRKTTTHCGKSLETIIFGTMRQFNNHQIKNGVFITRVGNQLKFFPIDQKLDKHRKN